MLNFANLPGQESEVKRRENCSAQVVLLIKVAGRHGMLENADNLKGPAYRYSFSGRSRLNILQTGQNRLNMAWKKELEFRERTYADIVQQ